MYLRWNQYWLRDAILPSHVNEGEHCLEFAPPAGGIKTEQDQGAVAAAEQAIGLCLDHRPNICSGRPKTAVPAAKRLAQNAQRDLGPAQGWVPTRCRSNCFLFW
jgi:hypothetical protein